MKGGGTVSHTKHPDVNPAKKVTFRHFYFMLVFSYSNPTSTVETNVNLSQCLATFCLI